MTSSKTIVSDLQADVLIIGSGGSGLPAAVTAADAGAKVIVVEKRKILGGTARIPGGILALETRAQKKQGVRDTVDDYFRKHMDYGNWTGEAMLVRGWLDGTSELIDWLESKGLDFFAEKGYSGPGINMLRIVGNTVNTGNIVVNTLINDAKSKGVEFITETTAKRLVKDEKGNVAGVVAEQEGKEITISAKAVMIATGSMSRNKELQKKYLPYVDCESMPQMQLPYCQGDGYFIAMDNGAAQDGLVGVLWIGPCVHPHNTRVGNVSRRPHMMVVNKHGKRYCDETMWSLRDFGWWTGMALDRQPGKVCWSIMDDNILKNMIKSKELVNGMEEIYGRIFGKSIDQVKESVESDAGLVANEEADPTAWLETLQEDIASEAKEGRIMIADSWDEIAAYIGCDPSELKDQVKRYNTFCKYGYDADLLKPKEWLLPLTTPPFYALQAHQGIDLIAGGIRITPNMEVMGSDDLKPIPGLYAGGVQCSGWFVFPSGEATGSGAISFSLYSGYVAGKKMAEYAASLSGK